MSLVVLSNSNTNQKDIDSNWNKAYSFHNSMKETMIIPPHSEVAVVSVKCNKDNLAVIDPTDTFYTMFGPDMRSDDYKNTSIEETTVEPILVQPLISTGSYLTDRTVVIKEEAVGMNEYKERLQEALERGWGLYPDLKGHAEVDFHYNSGVFAGFKMGTAFGEQQGDSNQSAHMKTWVKWNRDDTHDGLEHEDLVVDAQTFAKISSPASQSGVRNEENVSVGTRKASGPLSLRRGEIRFDIEGVCDPAEAPDYKVNTDCAFGIVRPQGLAVNPPNFDSSVGTLTTVDNAGLKQFYDYVIRMERKHTGSDRYLWVGVSAPYQNPDEGQDFKDIQMDEIIYYGWEIDEETSDFETQYNMSQNDLGINQFKIELNNEEVCFWYHTGDIDHLATGSGSTNNGGDVGEWKKLCSQNQLTKEKWETDPEGKHGRLHYPPPLGQQNWCQYPKVYIQGNSRNIVISKYGGIPNKFNYGDIMDCWAVRMYNTGQSERVAELECRNPFVVPYDIDSPGYYAQSGEVSTGSKLPFGYTYTLVTEPDEQLIPSSQANMGRQLGFTNNVVTPSTSPSGEPANPSGNLYQYTSTAIPDLTGDSSMFVRIDNLTQRSFNATVGRPSKIVYMLPRFDNSGNSQGTGLFYSPGERVYLELGNTEPLYLNEFAITMCDENEILVNSLTGNTVVIIHIRQSASRSMGHLDNKPFRLGAPQL